jgi:plasmid maintenance system antidote protein VapI
MTPLQSLIRERGLLQGFIADKLGVSPAQMSKIVHGRKDMRTEWVAPLAAVLRIGTDDLLACLSETRKHNGAAVGRRRKTR